MEELKSSPFALIGVNSDDTLEKARAVVKDQNLNWRSFQNRPDPSGRSISEEWAVAGWPTLIVLDADRRIQHRGHDGPAAFAVVRQLLEELQKSKDR